MTALGRLARSFIFRLALIYLVLFTGSVSMLIGVDYWLNIFQPLSRVKQEVAQEMDLAADTYVVDGELALVRLLNVRARGKDQRKPFHALLDAQGNVRTANLPSWPEQSSVGWVRVEADLYRAGGEDDHEALVLDHVFSDGARLIVGRDIEDIDEREEWLSGIMLWGGGATIILGVLGGLLMSVAVARRIEAVSRTARNVIAGDLSGRVETHGSGDDFDRLAETLNLMLERIEDAMEAVARVSDSVAHELRTPLARLRAELEDVVARDGREQAELVRALNEADRLQSVFDALLRIARIEAGRHGAHRQAVDLAALAADAMDLYQPVAEARGIALKADVPAVCAALVDPDLVFQALSNLLDNAVKFTPDKGRVRLVLDADEDRVRLCVTDTGPGIPKEHRARVCERFYTADTMPEGAPDDGAGGSAGVGLGLALVQAVAIAHGGTLLFQDDPDGFTACLGLPRPATEETSPLPA